MSSSFSTLSESLLETLSAILDMLDELHTVGIEFTVMRHENSPIGLEITLQCLLAEQKAPALFRIPKKDGKKPDWDTVRKI